MLICPNVPALPLAQEFAAAFTTDKLFPVEPGEAILAVYFSIKAVLPPAVPILDPNAVFLIAVSSSGYKPLATAFKKTIPAKEWGDHLRVNIYRLSDHRLLPIYKAYLGNYYGL